jgi:DNA-binding beta-propeller fold protein YncE
VLGTYRSRIFDEGAAEIVAYHAPSRRLFVVNAQAGTLDVLDVANPAAPVKVTDAAFAFNLLTDLPTLLAGFTAGAANSVSVQGDTVAIAVEASDKQAPGAVAFYDARTGAFINAVQVGALPDMLTFSPDGRYVLVANEGEPNDAYTNDPEGSVSVIDVSAGVGPGQPVVATAGFTAFNTPALQARLLALGAHLTLFGTAPSVAKDLEPEYIAVSPDSRTAWVTCQEANLVAVVDVATATVTQLLPLGFKNHHLLGNGLDPSDRDAVVPTGTRPRVAIGSWPVLGMYQPDAIATFTAAGQTYLVTANEGDVREYTGGREAARVSTLTLEAPLVPGLRDEAVLGRLNVTNRRGDLDGDPAYEQLYAFGGRSFSIWTTSGSLVFDSGDEFEQVVAARYPANFNATNDANNFDARSDDKGPEPEGVTVGRLGERTFAFIGLERVGGIMVYEVTDPRHARFVQYLNNRDFSVASAEASVTGDGAVGDLGPEGLLFIPAEQSPTGQALLVVGNEVSGTTTLYRFALP